MIIHIISKCKEQLESLKLIWSAINEKQSVGHPGLLMQLIKECLTISMMIGLQNVSQLFRGMIIDLCMSYMCVLRGRHNMMSEIW